MAAGLGGSSQQVIYPLLVADPGLAHVYTVLGTRTNANGTYIILRNPTAGGAPGGILLADPTWWVHYSYYANGAVLPVLPLPGDKFLLAQTVCLAYLLQHS